MPPSSLDRFSELLELARGGDAAALGKVLESYRVILGMLAAEELATDLQAKVDASDLVQKTFLDAQQGFHQFEGKSPRELQAWLEKMLHHNLMDCGKFWRRAEKRAIAREIPLETDSRQIDVVGEDTTPSKQAISTEEKKALDAALARLPADHRQVILLRYQDRVEFEDIAAVLDRSVEAVRKLWGRAVILLQKELREAGWHSKSHS